MTRRRADVVDELELLTGQDAQRRHPVHQRLEADAPLRRERHPHTRSFRDRRTRDLELARGHTRHGRNGGTPPQCLVDHRRPQRRIALHKSICRGSAERNTRPRKLRDAILAGDILPGQATSQIVLARELGVGRTPFREALRMLQHEGRVVVGRWRPLMASVTFGGPDLRTVYIGSLMGTTIPSFRSPVAGLPLAHWR